MATSDFNLGDLLNVGGTIWDYFNQKDTTQDTKKNFNAAYSNAANTIKQYNEPYINMGLESLNGYKDLGQFDFNASTWAANKDPSYDWRYGEGQRALERMSAAKGNYFSGNTATSLVDYGQNAASQEYQNAYNRALNSYNTNKDYWWKPIETGARSANFTGSSLADLTLGRAGDNAVFDQAKASGFSNLLDTAGIGLSPSIMNVADMVSKQLFGAPISDTMEQYGNEIVNGIKDFLGIGGSTTGESLLNLPGGATGIDLGNGFTLGADGLIPGNPNLGSGLMSGVGGLANLGSQGWTDLGGGFMLDQASGTITDLGGSATMNIAELESAASEAAAGAGQAGLGTQISQFLATPGGLGAVAAAMSLIMGGDVKTAALTGGLTAAGGAAGEALGTYIGTQLGMAGGPVGMVIGATLGGLATSLFDLGGYAKADSVMMQNTSGDTSGFKDKVYSEGPWGTLGFKGKATRHLDVGGSFQKVFNAATMMDNAVSGALTAEENAAMLQYYTDNPTFRKENNEGKINASKVFRSILKSRKKALMQVLGETRFNALNLGDFYDAAIASTWGKKKSASKLADLGYSSTDMPTLGSL